MPGYSRRASSDDHYLFIIRPLYAIRCVPVNKMSHLPRVSRSSTASTQSKKGIHCYMDVAQILTRGKHMAYEPHGKVSAAAAGVYSIA